MGAQTEMASKALDLSALNEKVKRSLLETPQAGELERIAEEIASEAERKAVEVRQLKERVFRAMFSMKRSRDLEKTTDDMDDAQKELEMKALQLKGLMKRAWKGMLASTRSRELERISDEMAEQLQTKAESIKNRIRKGLLRAHRAGELLEMKEELDELADSVPHLADVAQSGCRQSPPTSPPRLSSKERLRVSHQSERRAPKRWADYTSSDSDAPPKPCFDGRSSLCSVGKDIGAYAHQGEADVSNSDAESSGAAADSTAGRGSSAGLPSPSRE